MLEVDSEFGQHLNRRAVSAIIAAVSIMIGFALVGFFGETIVSYATPREKIPSHDKVTDMAILNRTKDLPEVRAFLERNPDAEVLVDRSSHFQVWYSVSESDITGKIWNDSSIVQPYVALVVRLDSDGYPESSFVCCTPAGATQQKITHDVVKYIILDGCQEFFRHYQDE